MNINRKVSTILLLIVIAAACLGYMFIKSLTAATSNKSYTATDIQNIQVDVENAKVHIESVEGRENKTEVEVVAKGKYDSSQISIDSNNNSLVIKQTGFHKPLNFNFNNSLDVYVKVQTTGTEPRLDQTFVSSQNGKIVVEHMNSRAIVVQSENGAINLKEITSDELSAHSTSGAIRLEEIITAKLETKADNGSSHIVFSDKLEKLNASSTSSSGSIAYILQNDIALDLKWKGKWDSNLKSDDTSPNKIVMESDSGNMSVNRK
ncbi:DUF4097 family beta strand repeat-containing protein [Paenibacillus nasutitermitis]|uniref:DUF4097 domain-containing protein n=1 Tax=Paenibacillus nasutitermitis TaxID=1652958 RepID=A0A916ZCW1_9BACL|nr:DUF4097 family beta strand repeat-containing protein [Paenibacillus nasutitermitis]GGD88848.1 hypothetical protein GCM10010911_54290 [Paenibacillus nasutitermitis]